MGFPRKVSPTVNSVGESETLATVGPGEREAACRPGHCGRKTRPRFSSLFAKPSCKTARCGRNRMLGQIRLEARLCCETQEGPRAT